MINWETKKFEDCLEKITYTNKIQRKDFLANGKFPIISQEQCFVNGYWNEQDDVYRLNKPVVIFGDHTKVLKFIDFDFVLGADGVKILKTKKEIEPKYFYYYLQNIHLGSLGYARHYKLLKDVNVCYPKLIEEQRRIVAILDKAFTEIDKAKNIAEQNLKNAKELFESYFQNIILNPENDWREKKLGQIANYFIGLTYSPKDVSDKGIIVLRSSNVQNDKLDFSDIVRVNCLVKDSLIVKDGDILMCSRNGSKRLVGKIATIKNLKEDMTFGTFMTIIRSEYNPFLSWFFRSDAFRSQINGGNNPMINQITKYMLDDILVTLPPLEAQKTIVAKLDKLHSAIKKLENVYLKKMENLEKLKKSFLKKAFAGEL
jgi:type I restriction enzyme S subunit